MKILAIETSCDETAISIIEASGNPLQNERASFSVLSNLVLSQVSTHAQYGGVFPALAKREHAKNLIPLLKQALGEAGMFIKKKKTESMSRETDTTLRTLLHREPELLDEFLKLVSEIEKPAVDAIAVTYGPGLEPALWVGINAAKALHEVWGIPLIPINHMEGHLLSALLKKESGLHTGHYSLNAPSFPVIALLISGGHTELVLMKEWLSYEIVGETKDDAAGEAFDKVARMLGLPYPGGPAISKLAELYQHDTKHYTLPRPMIHSGDFDFSFSGLKTAVLYMLKKIPELTEDIKTEIASEFQNAVTEVLVQKTLRAAEYYNTQTTLVGGGVSANEQLKETLKETPNISFAPKELTGDNALMIAAAAYVRICARKDAYHEKTIEARGSLRLAPQNESV